MAGTQKKYDLFGKPIRKKSTYEETKIQIDIIATVKRLKSMGVFKRWKMFIVKAANNERKATPQAGKRLNDMGRHAGVYDLEFQWGNSYPVYNAYMEVKTKDGKLTESQLEFKAEMEPVGIPCVIARSVGESLDWLKKWGIL